MSIPYLDEGGGQKGGEDRRKGGRQKRPRAGSQRKELICQK